MACLNGGGVRWQLIYPPNARHAWPSRDNLPWDNPHPARGVPASIHPRSVSGGRSLHERTDDNPRPRN
eukprot:6078185-Pleurochrysis_carterae.AAC.2